MKKLELTALNLSAKEILTRAQQKNVLGGDGSTLTCASSCQTYTGILGQPGYQTHFGSCSFRFGNPSPYCLCSAPGTILVACDNPS